MAVSELEIVKESECCFSLFDSADFKPNPHTTQPVYTAQTCNTMLLIWHIEGQIFP